MNDDLETIIPPPLVEPYFTGVDPFDAEIHGCLFSDGGFLDFPENVETIFLRPEGIMINHKYIIFPTGNTEESFKVVKLR